MKPWARRAVPTRGQMSGIRDQMETDWYFNDLPSAATPPLTDLIPVL
ncbi:MAG: hypothetical protein LBL72_00100 [Candidatus Accumulibacter sp.]|jgi:hypothetical protein|nr:hypothetical protein [Accumulibacter sp.]